MPTTINLSIKTWTALALNLITLEDWQGWAKNNQKLAANSMSISATDIPANLRRRCSNLTRASMLVAKTCLADQEFSKLPLIFASRHGESERSYQILNSIINAEPVSPNDFSLSVHNTSTGLFSMIYNNQAASSAISAGLETFSMGLVETYCYLQAYGGSVLYICTDEVLQPNFINNNSEIHPAYALAMVASKNTAVPQNNSALLTLELDYNTSSTTDNSLNSAQQIEDFLKWAFIGDNDCGYLAGINRSIKISAPKSFLKKIFVEVKQ